jgi:chemotaxis protein CheX
VSAPCPAVRLLPQILDLTQAKSLRDSLAAQLAGHAVVLDAGAVERMSTPCAQVLLAAARAAGSADASFRIINASAVFRTALADLGLVPEFCKWMD